MNIALMITGLGMGGAERQVCDLADEYIKCGHRVLLISITGDIVNRPKSSHIELVSIRMEKTTCGFFKAYYFIRKLLNEFKPDVVHSHMVHANIFIRLIRLTLKIPKVICTAHSSNEGGRGRMFAYRITDRLCDISTNVSQEAVDIFIKKGAVAKNRMIALHNGVDTENFISNFSSREPLRDELGLDHSVTILLSIGRLTEAKDYPSLLSAFSILVLKYNSLHLVIIGDGEEREYLTNLINEMQLTEKVHILGLRRDISDWINAADIFVLSSAWEGFGLVVAEAMACQRIVVATDCGGVKEVVGNCGILVPPRDHLALADGINKALQMSSDEIEMIGAAARDRIVTRYSLSAQAESWLSLYQ
ncbi:TPA: glycosyltransferase [Aeromonas veronii]